MYTKVRVSYLFLSSLGFMFAIGAPMPMPSGNTQWTFHDGQSSSGSSKGSSGPGSATGSSSSSGSTTAAHVQANTQLILNNQPAQGTTGEYLGGTGVFSSSDAFDSGGSGELYTFQNDRWTDTAGHAHSPAIAKWFSFVHGENPEYDPKIEINNLHNVGKLISYGTHNDHTWAVMVKESGRKLESLPGFQRWRGNEVDCKAYMAKIRAAIAADLRHYLQLPNSPLHNDLHAGNVLFEEQQTDNLNAVTIRAHLVDWGLVINKRQNAHGAVPDAQLNGWVEEAFNTAKFRNAFSDQRCGAQPGPDNDKVGGKRKEVSPGGGNGSPLTQKQKTKV